MRTGISLILLGLFMIFASAASAIPIEDVGVEDNLIAWDTLSPSSEANEAQWIADYLGVAVSSIIYSKLPDPFSAGSNWLEVTGDSEDLWAFDLGSISPDLFLVKTGNNVGLVGDGSSNTYSHYLYDNLVSFQYPASRQYGVINLNDFEAVKGSITIDIISHVSTVPEPSTIFLLGSGLLGLGLFRRKLKK